MDNPYGGINTRYHPWNPQSIQGVLGEKKQEIKQDLADELKNFLEPYIAKAEKQLSQSTTQVRYWGMLISTILIVLSILNLILQFITLSNVKNLHKRLFDETNVFSSSSPSVTG